MDAYKSQNSGKRIRTMLYTFGGALIIAALFFALYAIDGHASGQKSPLYTDLTKNPVYCKTGFDPAILSYDTTLLLRHSIMQWEKIVPPEYTGNYTVKNLLFPQEGDARGFLSPRVSPARDYTIMIPFTFGPETAAALRDVNVTPGLFLSGIGENWAVYINGVLVASNMHRNADGNIAIYQSLRDAHYPVGRDVFVDGVNIIVFHIVSSYASGSSGLFYASGYYIGDYADTVTQSASILTVVLCSIYVFMGLYHLLVFLMRRSEKYNLSYCFFALTTAIYFLSRTSIIYRFTYDTAITDRLECSAMYLLPLALAMFMDQMAYGRLKPFTKAIAALCTLLIAVQAVLPIDALPDTLLIGQLGLVVVVLYVVIYDTIIPFVRLVREKRKISAVKKNLAAVIFRELIDKPLGNIFIAMCLLVCTIFFDVFDTIFLHAGIVLSRYSFFLFTVSVAFILARRTTDAFTRIHSENLTLEAAVSARTAELEEQVRIAEFASRAKTDFLANMSHEIRTPINAVVGMTNIGRHTDDMEKKNYSLEKIAEASTHLLRIINDILDMSKIEANRLELSETHFAVRETVKRTADMICVKAEEKRQTLQVEYDEKIPAFLLGDEQRLSQVMTNLLSNAVKFTPENGSVTFRIAFLTADDAHCTLGVEVQDTGIGITAEQQEKLFTSFQQADNSTARIYGGTGLGLALSKRIVETMNGGISVQSAPGEGTTFSFTVELRMVADNTTIPSANVLESTDAPIDGAFEGRTALLAEDIDINQEIVRAVLEPTRIRIEVARNGQEALDLFMQNPTAFDIILMDVQMPVMDGYMATRAIRALEHPHAKIIPIIAMTANVFKEDIDNCLQAGMNAHVGKPLDVEELVTIMQRHINKKT